MSSSVYARPSLRLKHVKFLTWRHSYNYCCSAVSSPSSTRTTVSHFLKVSLVYICHCLWSITLCTILLTCRQLWSIIRPWCHALTGSWCKLKHICAILGDMTYYRPPVRQVWGTCPLSPAGFTPLAIVPVWRSRMRWRRNSEILEPRSAFRSAILSTESKADLVSI